MMDSTATGWYYALQGERVGPRSLDEVRSLVANGVLDADALVWTPGMRDWVRVSEVGILAPDWVQPLSAPAPRAEAEWVPGQDVSQQRAVVAQQPRPWRRFLARQVDSVVYGSVLLIIAIMAIPELQAQFANGPPAVNPLIGVPGTLAVALVEGIVLHLFGTTPGKALFGIRVSTAEGERLSLRRSFSRALRVWVLGMGAGFPYINLFTQIASYFRLTTRGRTLWDESLELEVEYEAITPGRAFAIVGLCLVLLFALGSTVAGGAPAP